MDRQRRRFTPDQRRALIRLGILSQQIDALEDVVLGIGSVVLRNEASAPARAEVQREFAKVRNALEAAHRALTDLEAARDGVPAHVARMQVRGSIELTSYSMGEGLASEGILHRVLSGLFVARAVVDRAIAYVPKAPTRHRTASPYPVSLVEKALLHGWATAHRDQPMPAYNCPAASGPTAPFRLVVQICYEAMGQTNDDPERAIKAFMKSKRAGRNAQRASDVPS